MQTATWWENVILGVLMLLIVLWIQPGIKQAIQRSKTVPADWRSVVVPLSIVVLWVIFLIMMV